MDIRLADCCALFYRATGISVSCYDEEGQWIISYPLSPKRSNLMLFPLEQMRTNPDAFLSPSHGAYGYVRVEGGGYAVVGPTYNIAVTDDIVRDYMRENYIALEELDATRALLQQTPQISYMQLLNKVMFLHYCLNGIIIDPMEHFHLTDPVQAAAVYTQNVRQGMSDMENQSFHNTYEWERQFFQLISNGDISNLSILLELSGSAGLTAGTLASTPLRQAQNIFIGTATKVGMLGAIPGGLDVELTYRLIDSYVQECERCATVSEVECLQVTMVMDFCNRVAAVKTPAGVSQEIYRCMCFIRNHTNEAISINEVAEHIQRSPSWVTKKFKKETGMSVGAYITQCKLEDAQRLLAYSGQSLAAISSYLCFSHQSHFQNVFKKKYGVTPLQYRKQRHI